MKPLYPGYMFVTFSIKNTQLTKTNNIYGGSRIITFNFSLELVLKELINYLVFKCDTSRKLTSIRRL